ncbi:hypothetical protein [Actinomadura gamaensis]|uniref:Uncharacterized protein n=1 Tax=Actinomadura gamaensis TaxID=1763541 RepID=A0ABV9U7Q2_9ACTN
MEAENAQLRDQVASLVGAEVVRLASVRMANGADLLTFRGADIAQYLTDAGTVDPAKVNAAVDELLSERPYLAREALTRFQGSADQGVRANVPAPSPPRLGAIFTPPPNR